jgi:hypothetical protein
MKNKRIIPVAYTVVTLFIIISGCSRSPISHAEIKRLIKASIPEQKVAAKFWPKYDRSKYSISDSEIDTKNLLSWADIDLRKSIKATEKYSDDLEKLNVDEIKIVKTGDTETLKTEGCLHVKAYLKGSFGDGKYPFAGEAEYRLVKDPYGKWSAYRGE